MLLLVEALSANWLGIGASARRMEIDDMDTDFERTGSRLADAAAPGRRRHSTRRWMTSSTGCAGAGACACCSKACSGRC